MKLQRLCFCNHTHFLVVNLNKSDVVWISSPGYAMFSRFSPSNTLAQKKLKSQAWQCQPISVKDFVSACIHILVLFKCKDKRIRQEHARHANKNYRLKPSSVSRVCFISRFLPECQTLLSCHCFHVFVFILLF